MTRVLDLILDQQVDAATRLTTQRTAEIDAKAAASGTFRSGARIKQYISAYSSAVDNLIKGTFGQASAAHERAGVSVEDAREAAISRVERFIDELERTLRPVVESTGMTGEDSAALRAAKGLFGVIRSDFQRTSELYRAGVSHQQVAVQPAVSNTLNVSGTGHNIIAQQGTVHSVQTVEQTHSVVDQLAAVIDDAPLSKTGRAEVETMLAELRAEAAKPVRDKVRLTGILSGIGAAVGVLDKIASPETVKALADTAKVLGIA